MGTVDSAGKVFWGNWDVMSELMIKFAGYFIFDSGLNPQSIDNQQYIYYN